MIGSQSWDAHASVQTRAQEMVGELAGELPLRMTLYASPTDVRCGMVFYIAWSLTIGLRHEGGRLTGELRV